MTAEERSATMVGAIPGKQGVVTFAGVAHPWMCDAMGHLNVRHYAAMFDDASFQLLGKLSGTGQAREVGWADVRHEVEFMRETPAGTLLTIRTAVVRIGRSSVAYRHEMASTISGQVHAVSTVTSVRFDLSARKSLDLDPETRHRAEALLSA